MGCLPRTRGDRWRRASTAGAGEEKWLLWAKAGRTTDHAMMGDEVLTDCPQSARRASQSGVIICREGNGGLDVEGIPDFPACHQTGCTVRLEDRGAGGLYAWSVARCFYSPQWV